MQFKMLQYSLVVFSVFLLVLVFAAPAPVDEVKIDSYNYKSLNDQNEYYFDYKLSDGQERMEKGYLKTDGNGDEKFVVSGSYQYIGPDGVEYSVVYIADENGFQPFGVHLPGSGAISIPEAPLPSLGISPNAITSLIG